MKKPEEIKKGLECCATDECHGEHSECPYNTGTVFCIQHTCADALTYIQQLENKVALYDECVADALQLERERDAAIAELYGKCPYCINYIPNGFIKCFHLATCKHIGNGGTDDNWQWRGAPVEE